MNQSVLIEDFKSFFLEFQSIWNSCNTELMISKLSLNLSVRWANADGVVSDWGYKEACLGWAEAFEQYCGHNPKWNFTILHTTPASEDEVIVLFWVTFEMDGEKKEVVKLFVQRFKRYEDGWKLLHEYCESLRSEAAIL
ncbi:hypothetical protein [Bacillus sp. D386]|uniref:hypothetical protein n=1 Tax=Bacillus sp. D386 TaxID=2587155 RepID=UPI00112483BB|nr:hypothetical protein [Bacillus sp. D386]